MRRPKRDEDMVEDRDEGQVWTEGPQMFTSTNASSTPPAGYKLLDLKTVAAQSTLIMYFMSSVYISYFLFFPRQT